MQRNTHPVILEWNNVKISSSTAKVGGGEIRKEARDRGKKDLEEGGGEMEISTKGTSVDFPVGHKSFGKKKSPLSPHSLLQFFSCTHNLTLACTSM